MKNIMHKMVLEPGFFLNEKLSNCSVYAHFLYPCLVTMADKNGVSDARPRYIRNRLVVDGRRSRDFTAKKIEELLQELENSGVIEISGDYLRITGYLEHQAKSYNAKSVHEGSPWQVMESHDLS